VKVVKILLTVLASLLVLAIIGAVLLVWLFDPNDYKDYVTDLVEERTGRTLSIEDDLELSFFPWLAVETGGITVGNAPGFTDRPFATVDRGAARVRLWPLLTRREFEVGTISLDGVELNLARDADGVPNWQDLIGSEPSQPGGSASTGPSTSMLDSLDIEGIDIRGSRVFWRENVDETRYVVNELNLSTGAISRGEAFDVEIAFDLLDVAEQLSARIDSEAEITLESNGAISIAGLALEYGLTDGSQVQRARGSLDVENASVESSGRIAFGPGSLTGDLVDPPIGPASLPVAVSWQDGAFDPSVVQASLNGLNTAVGGIVADWRIEAQSLAESPRLTGAMTVRSAAVADLLDLLEIETPAGMNHNELGDFTASTGFDLAVETQSVSLTDTQANVLGMDLRVQNGTVSPTRAVATLEVAPFAPNEQVRALLAHAVPEDVNLGALERLAFSGAVDANLENGALRLENFTAELLGARITGNLNVADSVYAGSISTSPFAPAGFIAAFDSYLTDTVNASELGTLLIAADFRYDSGNDSATLNPLRLEAVGVSARGELAVEGVSGSPRLTGRATVADFDPRQLIRRFGQEPPQTSDPTALRRVSIDTRFEMTSALGRFDSLVVMLDDNRISGNFIVDDFNDPSYRFDLEIDGLDVDRYLPPQGDEATDGERRAGDLAIEREPLEVLEMDGSVRVGNLRLAGMSYQNVRTDISVGNGRLLLDSAHADLYGGQFDGSFRVDASGDVPNMTLRGQADSLALAPLITAVAGDASFSGTASFDIDLTGEGANVTDNLRSAAGTMGFALHDGAIDGFNVVHKLCGYYNYLRELPQPDQNQPKITPYELIEGTAMVSEGVATSRDLLVRSPDFQVRGAGQLSLVDQIANYDFEARITRSIKIPGCESMDRTIGIDFPLDMEGPVTSPEITPDYSEILQRLIRDEIGDRVRDSLRERLGLD
jgi:uncharacterized protein involved in outer membrane biogenesis